MPADTRPQVVITRWLALLPRPAYAEGVAWGWRYDARLPDGRALDGVASLGAIERAIRDAGAVPVRDW